MIHNQRHMQKRLVALWDGRDFLGRLKLIMDYKDLFWSLGLVTTQELAKAMTMKESAQEYVLAREDQPFFTSINLKKELKAQENRDKLEAALRAVFL